MSKPKRHGSARSITAIVLSTPLVSAISLTELGMKPISRLAPASCKAAYNRDIPDCSMTDFTSGCSKSCRAGVAEMSTTVSRACAGGLLGGLIAPFVSGTDQLLLCANGFLASLVGATSTSMKSTQIPLLTTQTTSISTTSVLPPPPPLPPPTTTTTTTSDMSSSIIGQSTVLATTSLPLNSSSLPSPTSSSADLSRPTQVPATSSSGTLPFVISFSAPSTTLVTSLSSQPLIPTTLISVSPIQSLLSSSLPSGTTIISWLPSNSSSNSSSSSGILPPIVPVPATAQTSITSTESIPASQITSQTTSTTPLTPTTAPATSSSSSISTLLTMTSAPPPVVSSMAQSLTSSTSSTPAKSSQTADVGGISAEVPAAERTATPNAGIIGGVLGGSIAVAMLTTTLFYFCLRRYREKRPRRLSSWDFIDRPRARSEASLISIPPVSYFDQPPVIPQEAMLARTNSESRYPRRTQGTSTNYSSILGNYDSSERGSRDVDLRQATSGPPRWTPLRENPSPIFEEVESLQTLTFFERAGDGEGGDRGR